MSAPRWQRVALRDLGAIAQNGHDAAEPLGQARFQARVLEHETEHLRQAVAHRLEAALEVEIVRQVQLADAGGIAAAAKVLEQQRVIQFPQLVVVQASGTADMHPDPAAAHAVASGLAFGNVERIAQGANQLGELHGARGQHLLRRVGVHHN
jgi:hypothetical protein